MYTRLPTSLLCWLMSARRDTLRRFLAAVEVCSNALLNARPCGRSSAQPPHWNCRPASRWSTRGAGSLGTGPQPQCELSPELQAFDTAWTSTALDSDCTNACSRLSASDIAIVHRRLRPRYPGVKLRGGGFRRISDPAPLIWDPVPLITDPAPFCWDTPLCWVESKHRTLLKCHKNQIKCLECSKTPGRRSGTPPLLSAFQV